MMRSKFYLAPLLMLQATVALAVSNLPLSCKTPVASGAICATADYACVPGKDGISIATPSGVWTKWEALKPTDKIRAWKNDLVPGVCNDKGSGDRFDIQKADATSEATVTVETRLPVSWTLPTTYTNNQTIPPSNPIAAVQLVIAVDHTIPDDPAEVAKDAGYIQVDLAGTATSYETTLTTRQEATIYVRARVTLKDGSTSAYSSEASWTIPRQRAEPNTVTSLSISQSQPTE